ncbi:HupE/UreJ family protein [Cryobacterium melibiosiphilum]|uniref:HupE/UreJ family protein n=1 Tax=Cryobacterium melibiosiphilum TaxID=995039 RepID=A0A3A5MQ24_9MICO|nr:HupE/UreJ family protein [Cryobacterium melibiosiphilum]RJT91045.1 HupE/UreJ family protein [Cryobacterium melibiosiphilum]
MSQFVFVPRPPRRFRSLAVVVGLVAAAAGTTLAALPASAHGFESTVYVDAVAADTGDLRADIYLEYDLLVVSAAENQDDPGLFNEGMDLFETGDEAIAMNAHADTVRDYVQERFQVTFGGEACSPVPVGEITMDVRDDVPYALLVLDFACAAGSADSPTYEVTSTLFPDVEDYVTDTKTIVTYDLDGRSGSAALDSSDPTFSTGQAWHERFLEFFLLGAEHLAAGPDHLLFLLALIVGSRRLRDVVLAATAFTVAHSLTFVIAALNLVAVPAAVVEPIIALSIAVVAAWPLWINRRRSRLVPGPAGTAGGRSSPGRWAIARAEQGRLAVVFCFGLVHGLGFAGALGIDEAWSWTLLWSLLVFNVGIEVVQLAIIACVFPLLSLLRRRMPRVGVIATVMVSGAVAAFGLVWFAERIFALA